MASDNYGLNDFSALTGSQQDTARMIQKAFANSQARYGRDIARYPAFAQTSAPLLQESLEDQALKRAEVTSNTLNQNQQLQNLIDASHHTPHGLQENLAAYLPWLGAGLKAWPALFGTDSSLSRQGIIPAALGGVKKAVHYFTDPASGQTYGLDETGNVIPPAQLGGNVDYGVPYGESTYGMGAWNPRAVDFGSNAPDYGAAVTTPYDFGAPIEASAIPAIADVDYGAYF